MGRDLVSTLEVNHWDVAVPWTNFANRISLNLRLWSMTCSKWSANQAHSKSKQKREFRSVQSSCTQVVPGSLRSSRILCRTLFKMKQFIMRSNLRARTGRLAISCSLGRRVRSINESLESLLHVSDLISLIVR